LYARAREIRADARFERVDQVIEDMRAGVVDAQQARVEIDAIKWQAAKEAPSRYGDRLEVAGDPAAPLVQVQGMPALLALYQELAARARQRTVEARPAEIEGPAEDSDTREADISCIRTGAESEPKGADARAGNGPHSKLRKPPR
jgi:hypothetical protein